jgi:hypothetical protein
MVRPIEKAPICLSLEEVTVRAGHKVLMEVDDNISLIVGNPQGISDQQLRPRPRQTDRQAERSNAKKHVSDKID